MLLGDILKNTGLNQDKHQGLDVTNIHIDSRQIKPGGLFLALAGTRTQGSRFLDNALANGAVCAITEENVSYNKIPVIQSDKLKKQIVKILDTFYGGLLKNLYCIGITGTNGKSTITQLTGSLIKANGQAPISIGTIKNAFGDKSIPSTLTTPDPVEIMNLINQGRALGCNYLVMEVSSHALSQDRISGISFDRAVFTNLTHDHLDYHNTMEEYFISKRRLFTEYLSGEGLAIINMDSEYGVRLKSELGVRSLGFTRKCLSQAEKGSDVTLESADMVMGETKLTISYRGNIYRFQTNLWGDINIENLLATVTLGLSMGFSETVISRALANVYVQGRCESIKLPVGAMAVIDYAHTPDALERIIKSLRGLVEGRLVCLFGCGGDRDKDKRPKMGKIAAENADETLITSDNPRSERPEDIIEDILKGIIIKDNVRAIADRRDAIYTALNSLTKGDCLLIAGKGHEDYQIIGDKKSHFSDQEEVEAWMHSQRADLNEAGNGH